MKIALRNGGATKPVVGFHFRVGGATKVVERAWLRTGGVLKQFYGGFSVGLSADEVDGFSAGGGSVPTTTNAVTATPTGGIGTLSYLWTRTDGDPHAWTINSPTSQATTFTTLCAALDEHVATFICTVTDQAGQSVPSDAVTADCRNDYSSGGPLP